MGGKPSLLFLIHSLAAGGAERQLCELVSNIDRRNFELHVLVFYQPGHGARGELWPEIASLPDVELHCLDKRRGPLGYVLALPRVLKLMRRVRPDILHGYSDGNLPALLLGMLYRRRVVWGIRRTSRDLTKMNRLSLALLRVMVKLSRFVDLIIFNSEAGRLNHERMGMRAARMRVIPNGFDTDRFSPDRVLGLDQKVRWGIPAEAPLVGIVGRFDPVKDHPTFLRAAARVAAAWPEARFVCVGGGPEGYQRELQEQAEALGIGDRVHWPGICREMVPAYNALTVLMLSSTDEGFPNVIGEAMACGVPCVATKAGDAAQLIGETGFAAEVGDDAALAEGVGALLAEGEEVRADRSRAARERICSRYSVHALAVSTEHVLLNLLTGDAFQSPHRKKPDYDVSATWPKGLPIPARREPREIRSGEAWPDSGPLQDPAHGSVSGPKYLIRFDDVCPTMNWDNWNRIESVLLETGAKPILSVVPDNRDPNLMVAPPDPAFWERVRAWQKQGWTIGLHGYQHTYVNRESGILRLNRRSEFAGLDYAEQYEKLSRGLDIFSSMGVRADAWVAPAHSFDWVTVAALNQLKIRVISDGLSTAPYRDHLGNVWVPQQFASMRGMPFGLWTYCYHLNHASEAELRRLEDALRRFRDRLVSLPEAAKWGDRPYSGKDRLVRLARATVSAIQSPSRTIYP
jgi:glycosyltransferase involved in cell wall biosynthesis/predicted deacetylase